MASASVLWFGETMSAVPLRNNKAAASAVRSVTVLGATGSIGDSTMDLLRGARDRYQVEALTANTNVPALAKLYGTPDPTQRAGASPRAVRPGTVPGRGTARQRKGSGARSLRRCEAQFGAGSGDALCVVVLVGALGQQ